MYKRKNNQQLVRRGGFTLLELLIVLGIILAIAAMVVPNLLGRQQEANIKQTMINIKNFEQTVKQYAATHNGEFPQGGSSEVIQLLMSGESADGQMIQPYLEEVPKDAWGMQLFYEFPNTKDPNGLKPAIWSSGPDKQNQDGGGDDITNWNQANS